MDINHTFIILAYKESPYLEDCIKSVLKQNIKSEVFISTSTPNEFIDTLAKKYRLELIVNNKSGLANDFNFALSLAHTRLVTLAHQDDIYYESYSENLLNAYRKNNKALILFTDYDELRDKIITRCNLNLFIKKVLLFILRFSLLNSIIFFKRLSISFGSSISCPTVCYVVDKIKPPLFDKNYRVSLDYKAWETLSRKEGSFIYIPKHLMAHRIHKQSMTSKYIELSVRQKEDIQVLNKFWPKSIANLILYFYKFSEKSNQLK